MKKRICYFIAFIIGVIVYNYMQNVINRSLIESVVVMLLVYISSTALIEKKLA